jgi:quinolinate synthase
MQPGTERQPAASPPLRLAALDAPDAVMVLHPVCSEVVVPVPRGAGSATKLDQGLHRLGKRLTQALVLRTECAIIHVPPAAGQ